MNDGMNGNRPDEAEQLHREQTERLVAGGIIRSQRVKGAFRAIPRHLFLPGVPLEKVYQDEAIITKVKEEIPLSSSSQPSLMAIMLEQLDLHPGHRVLEIGTATGYNAALMAHIVGPAGHVTTLDIDEDLIEGAREHLAAAGVRDVEAICRDGGYGWPEGAPYDRIILTVGAWDIAPAWIEQLAPDGRLLLPLALVGRTQEAIAFEWRGDHLESVSTQLCGFLQLRGDFKRPEGRVIDLPPDNNVRIQLGDGDGRELDPERIAALLKGPYHDTPTGIEVSAREVFIRLMRWIELQLPHIAALTASDAAAVPGAPYLIGRVGRYGATLGSLGPESAAVLTRSPQSPLSEEEADQRSTFPLWVRSYGAPEEGRLLLDTIAAWESAGRSATGPDFRVRAYPDKGSYRPEPGDMVIEKEHVLLALNRG